MKILSIIFTLLLFVVVIGGFFLAFKFYLKENKKSFSFLTQFPSELLETYGKRNFSFYVSVLSSSFIKVISILFLTINLSSNGFSSLVFYMIVLNILAFAQDVFLIVSHMINAFYIKEHIISFVVCSLLTLLTLGMLSIANFNLYRILNRGGVLVVFCITCLILVFEIVILLNPKLKNWPNLNKNINDGSFNRGKVFIFAFSEWLTYFVNVLETLLILLLMLFI